MLPPHVKHHRQDRRPGLCSIRWNITYEDIIGSYDIFLHAFVSLDLFVDRICQYQRHLPDSIQYVNANLARVLRDAPNKQRQMVPCLLNIYEPIPRMCRVYGNLYAIWEMKDMQEQPLNNLVKFPSNAGIRSPRQSINIA